jgi:hypothetical protein
MLHLSSKYSKSVVKDKQQTIRRRKEYGKDGTHIWPLAFTRVLVKKLFYFRIAAKDSYEMRYDK